MGEGYPSFSYIQCLQTVSTGHYIECKLEARRIVQMSSNITSKSHNIQVHINACVVF
jgi:hypothetical protein